MYRATRTLTAASLGLSLVALAACGDDRSVNPVAEQVDGAAGAITTASTITAEYDLYPGQSVKIRPQSTSRTNRLRWTTTNSGVATVNSQGTVSAKVVGNAVVTVSGSGVLESYAVVVEQPVLTLTSFSLQPQVSVTLTAGQTQQFSTSQTWSDGVTRTSGVTYTATGGTITSTGLYTAGSLAGAFMVVASCSCTTPAIADTTFVTVQAAAQLTKLTVSPKTVSLNAGASQQFAVTANWSTGATTLPPVTWSASGGTVSGTGAYVAPSTAGTYRVIVAHTGGTVRDTAVVTVGGEEVTPPPANTFGPGANAPAWSGKTVYREELFNTPIPVHYAGENSAGFKGWQGFDGAWGTIHNPTRVTYPVVNTPLGVKPVLQITYPGSSAGISTRGATTTSWPTNQAWGVRVTGSWSGTLAFERSSDGQNWSTIELVGSRAGSGTVSATGTQTSVNGVWISNDALTLAGGFFRVRAVDWVSGTATVAVGMQGGAAAARMSAGSFSGNPTRIYTRVMIYVDPSWNDGANTGTKFFFFSQLQGNNHYTGLFSESGAAAFVGLQASSNRNFRGSTVAANGNWMDVEFLFVANTPGQSNGSVKAWVNGVESLNAADVMYFAAGAVPGFSSLWMDPTYGGGMAPPPRNVFFRIAGWYRESAP